MGEAIRAIEITVEYVNQRKAFGDRLFAMQGIRQRLALLGAKVEAARQLVYHTAWLDAQGEDCVKEVSMAKALCGELVNRVMYECLQFHGGAGYLHESAIEPLERVRENTTSSDQLQRALVLLGKAYRLNGDYERAALHYGDSLDRFPRAQGRRQTLLFYGESLVRSDRGCLRISVRTEEALQRLRIVAIHRGGHLSLPRSGS